jgi:DNA-binding transcriptional MerR regulator
MDILKDRYSITELSLKLNVTDHTLRYYEKEFNLHIPKDERGRRYYIAEQANILYQIKNMRDEGLEIKAIKKILQSENIINVIPEVYLDDSSIPLVPINNNETTRDLSIFLTEMKEAITNSISYELSSTKDQISKEITKSKLELGACVENSIRKLETKMERHFQEVDKSLGKWREKNKKSFIKKFLNKMTQ